MTPNEIKAGLMAKGSNQSRVAESLKISVAAVSLAIAGKSESARVKAKIAEILGVPIGEVWK